MICLSPLLDISICSMTLSPCAWHAGIWSVGLREALPGIVSGSRVIKRTPTLEAPLGMHFITTWRPFMTSQPSTRWSLGLMSISRPDSRPAVSISAVLQPPRHHPLRRHRPRRTILLLSRCHSRSRMVSKNWELGSCTRFVRCGCSEIQLNKSCAAAGGRRKRRHQVHRTWIRRNHK